MSDITESVMDGGRMECNRTHYTRIQTRTDSPVRTQYAAITPTIDVNTT
jgi:hypothetical protein